MTFGIDIDECLRHLLSRMVKLYNENFHQNMTVDDAKDYVVENSFPAIAMTGQSASKWFFQDHGKELFRLSKPIGDVSDYISRLRKYGKVILISYQKSYTNKIDILWWLDKHEVEYDGICFVKDKSIVHTDYLCDDNSWNFGNSNTEHAILITAPYNKEDNLDDILATSNCKDIQRFDTLEQFVEYIETKFENNEK